MARKLTLTEKKLMRFPAGTLARISSVLDRNEDQASFIRDAVDAAVKRAECDRKPLIEGWTPELDELRRVTPRLVAMADRAKDTWRAPYRDEPWEISVPSLDGLRLVSCIMASPHIDDGHETWFVMMVLRSRGHVLHVADIANVVKNPQAQVSAPLVDGDIFILNAHRLHWLTPSPALPDPASWPGDPDRDEDEQTASARTALVRDHWFIAVEGTSDLRPSRAEAEAMVLGAVRKSGAAA